ncbi:DUF4376 domain-containing protein [Escherichia coli]|uniref:DUF4376 domain-containing protein n=1 Tax=Escherichia coli TaxID=562 RepID=UPI001F567EAA|nr:DUF4376 domain-containing protein [Escherichia coli]
MGKYIYSPSRNLFYPVALKTVYEQAGCWPEDGMVVDDVLYREQMSAGTGENETAEIARERKLAEISRWRDEQENAGVIFEWQGHRWDGGKAARSRLSPVTAVAQAGALPEGFFWTDVDNRDVRLTAEELVQLDGAMLQAMVTQGFKIHERQRQMKEEIARLGSADAIRGYVVGWGNE